MLTVLEIRQFSQNSNVEILVVQFWVSRLKEYSNWIIYLYTHTAVEIKIHYSLK